jgi:hypothetical protein
MVVHLLIVISVLKDQREETLFYPLPWFKVKLCHSHQSGHYRGLTFCRNGRVLKERKIHVPEMDCWFWNTAHGKYIPQLPPELNLLRHVPFSLTGASQVSKRCYFQIAHGSDIWEQQLLVFGRKYESWESVGKLGFILRKMDPLWISCFESMGCLEGGFCFLSVL